MQMPIIVFVDRLFGFHIAETYTQMYDKIIVQNADGVVSPLRDPQLTKLQSCDVPSFSHETDVLEIYYRYGKEGNFHGVLTLHLQNPYRIAKLYFFAIEEFDRFEATSAHVMCSVKSSFYALQLSRSPSGRKFHRI